MIFAFILGLLLLLAAHSIRIFADGWRTQKIARLGEGRWKLLHSLTSLAGVGLMIWSFRAARADSSFLWTVPRAMRLAAVALNLIAFVFVAAAYVPGNRIKAKLGHPMVLGTMIWAFAHLMVNGTVLHAVLFGGFLLWAVLEFRALRRRDRLTQKRYPALGRGRDVLAVGAGAIAWFVFARFGHLWLIGVSPLGP